MTAPTTTGVRRGIGATIPRADGVAKADGSFVFSSDHEVPGMLWGATVRSDAAHGRITSIESEAALHMDGVLAVLVASDIPGTPYTGLAVNDQAVLAADIVDYVGQPVCVVAADHPEQARLAAEAIRVECDELEPLIDPERAVAAGSLYDEVHLRRGNEQSRGSVVVSGSYEIASQDQAALGTESGIAIPDGAGGLDLYAATQWIHDDHRQLVAVLNVESDALRLHPTGVGGAFGSREDLSVHAHLCLLAMATGRPVKMVLNRTESFLSHVHRHAAHLDYRLEADESGELMRLEGRIVIDGGAYTSTSPAVNLQAASFAAGPYRIGRVEVDGYAARTNNPAAGAMRGFGATQVCFAYEDMMDRMARALGMDPVDLRRRNLLSRGERLSTTGQEITSSFPAAEVLDRLVAVPPPDPMSDDPRHMPGGTGRTASSEHVKRGIGIAVGIKGIGFSGGFDDYADAMVRIVEDGVEVHTAAMEVGQGLVTVLAQIARTTLGIDDVEVVFDHTGAIGSSGCSAASRQTQVSGGAVHEAAEQLKQQILDRFRADRLDRDGAWIGGECVASWITLAQSENSECRVRYRHPATESPDENLQGRLHPEFAVFANRAVVDVDVELGLVRVVSLEAVQDVGRVINPPGLVGQVEGGAAQGLGLATMEGLIVENGHMLNGSFADYLIPTALDMPPMRVEFLEEAAAWGPYGAKGAGEAPTIASGPAIAAAVRDAVGRAVTRFPIRPEDAIADPERIES